MAVQRTKVVNDYSSQRIRRILAWRSLVSRRDLHAVVPLNLPLLDGWKRKVRAKLQFTRRTKQLPRQSVKLSRDVSGFPTNYPRELPFKFLLMVPVTFQPRNAQSGSSNPSC